jgi:hypothetical protein
VSWAQTEWPAPVPTAELDAAPYDVSGAIRAEFVSGGITVSATYGSASVVNHPQVAISAAHVFNDSGRSLWSARQWYTPRVRWNVSPSERGHEVRGVIAYAQYNPAQRAGWDAVAMYAYLPLAGGLFGLSLPEADVQPALRGSGSSLMVGFPSDATGSAVPYMSRLGPRGGAFTEWPAGQGSVEWYRWGQAPRAGMSGGGLWMQTARGWRFAGIVTAYGQSGSQYCAVVHPYRGGTAALFEEAVYALVPNGEFWKALPRGGDGWRVSSWLGPVNTQLLPWAWHAGLGWVFAPLAADESAWLYLPEVGWVWTRQGLWPTVYVQRTDSWFHFRQNPDGGGWWYDYTRRTWVLVPGGA